MKSSSRAIFTRQNIFPPDPRIPKTHYNPSPTKKLPKKQRKTNLSPVRLAKPASPFPWPPSDPGPPSDPVPCVRPSTEPQHSFSESWPSTDQESSPANTADFPRREALTLSSGKHRASSTPTSTQGDSVLAKYVDRFRHGQPQSREERQRSSATVEEWHPFWWLSSSSSPPSSGRATAGPAQEGHASAHNRDQLGASPVEHMRPSPPLSPRGAPLDFTALGLSGSSPCDPSLCDPPDAGIQRLQERASMLLQRSEHSLSSSSLPISSEGVGSSDLSSPFSTDEPVQRPIMNLVTALDAPPPVGAFLAPPRSRPEDDILFQWRLRRKMEQARQWPLPLSRGPARPLGSSLAPQAQRDLCPLGVPTQGEAQLSPAGPWEPSAPAAPGSAPVAPGSAPVAPGSAPVPSHMHLLCDLLPCPLRHGPREGRRRRRRSPEKWEVPTRDPAPGPPTGSYGSTGTESPSPPPERKSGPQGAESESRGWSRGEEPKRRSSPQWEEPERRSGLKGAESVSRSGLMGAESESRSWSQGEEPMRTSSPQWEEPERRSVLRGAEPERTGWSQGAESERRSGLKGAEPERRSWSRGEEPKRSSDLQRAEPERRSWSWGEEPKRRSDLQRAEPERGQAQAVPSCSRRKSTRVGEGSRVDVHRRPTQAERGVSRDRAGEERPEEPRRAQRGQRSRKEGHPGDGAPPPSPISDVLGQVVSEVLFPTSDPPAPAPSGRTPPVPPRSPLAPALPQCPAAAAPGVVAQLLEEAEESDGLEFDDDPLLQVLRHQREWVKEQISEVDTILSEIQDDT